jgi:multisubunit Na+/H+ antiporter MnhE subunit
MGKSLVQWFIFSLIVSFFIAYLTSRTVAPGTPYLQVFRVVGTIGFLAYAAAQIPAAIWMGKPWSVAWKEVFDGLLYGCVTAGTFGWLWPR